MGQKLRRERNAWLGAAKYDHATKNVKRETRNGKRIFAACLVFGLLLATCAIAELPPPAPARLSVVVVDENGVAVPRALVLLTAEGQKLRYETDFAGRCEIAAPAPGAYHVRIEKQGFYQADANLSLPDTRNLDVRLIHEQEIRETVDVVESPPAIDPEKIADTQNLGQREILNIPYPTTRDVRNVLPAMPGVVLDQSGEIHVAGSARVQTLNLLDGFDVSQPVSGFLDMRVNADAIRAVDVDTGRYTVQYGRGDSVLDINTGIGDDRFRFVASNFLPSFQDRHGLHFNQWVPRAVLSGPIKRGRVWFYEAPDVEYSETIIVELPPGQDTAKSWRTGNLAKLQANFTDSDILVAEFLVNDYHAPHAGLSAFNPLPTTTNQRGSVYIGALKDQHYFKSGMLLESGLAVDYFTGSQTPLGNQPPTLNPQGPQGSSYASIFGGARRWQWINNAFLPSQKWHGRHEFRVGGDLDRLYYYRTYERTPISIFDANGDLARQVLFTPYARVSAANLQASLYAQDRWNPFARLILEGGLRADWDEIIEQPVVAPRLAGSYTFDKSGNTKLSAGVGRFYLATDLDLISRPLTGVRTDILPGQPPVTSQFFVNHELLKEPRSFNWNIGLEQRLPAAVYASVQFLDKRLSDGFLFVPAGGPGLPPCPGSLPVCSDRFSLTNGQENLYRSLTLSLRHSFRNIYPLMVSYTRSSAHTNALIDYSVDNLAVGPQQGGPLPWDAPNRVVAWGWFPAPRKLEMGYSLDWRDGFPFSAVDQQQFLFGQPDAYRFPHYFNLTLAAERRFQVHKLYLAIRISAEDITGWQNPNSVNNNIDAYGNTGAPPPHWQFAGTGHRAFTGRIRFLGRSAKGQASSTTAEPSAP